MIIEPSVVGANWTFTMQSPGQERDVHAPQPGCFLIGGNVMVMQWFGLNRPAIAREQPQHARPLLFHVGIQRSLRTIGPVRRMGTAAMVGT
jgi:hypothetical protein